MLKNDYEGLECHKTTFMQQFPCFGNIVSRVRQRQQFKGNNGLVNNSMVSQGRKPIQFYGRNKICFA